VIFLLGVLLAAAMAYGPLADLFASRLARDYHSLIPFIPIISLYLLYLKRKEILSNARYAFAIGTAVIIAGVAFYAGGFSLGGNLNLTDRAAVLTASSLVLLWGTFIFAYGMKAFQSALFPLLFLVFMIPLPYAAMDALVTFLQKGSTEFANLLLWLSQAPYVREGFCFHLPGFSVEVAPQCSGIRSGLALFITALLAGYLFLKSWRRRAILALCVIPVTMFKNGIRITTDPAVLLYGSADHRKSPAPGGRHPLFYLGAAAHGADPLLSEKKRGEREPSLGAGTG